MKTVWERLYNGIIKENPTFVLMLGMCPTLAVTSSALNGLGMGLSTCVVLMMSNLIISLVRKGKAGVEEIAAIMTDLRNNPPKDLAGSPVVKIIDYNEPEKTGLPKSNVLQFFSEAGDVVSVRPSGTEPKIKFYFGAHGDDANAKIETLKAQFAR